MGCTDGEGWVDLFGREVQWRRVMSYSDVSCSDGERRIEVI